MSAVVPHPEPQRRFFYVSQRGGRREFCVFHGDPPTEQQARALGTVIFRQELAPPLIDKSLNELAAIYEILKTTGQLPPDNMQPPFAERTETRPSYDTSGPSWWIDEVMAEAKSRRERKT
jgi:hypothetical protein